MINIKYLKLMAALFAAIFFIFSSLFYFHGCRNEPKKNQEDKAQDKTGLPAGQDLASFKDTASSYEADLLATYIENDYLVYRYESQLTEDKKEVAVFGDSAMFTGVALGILECERARKMFDGIYQSIIENQGGIIRYPGISKDYDDGQSSRDMMAGMMFGFVRYDNRCKDERVKAAWSMHLDFIQEHGSIHPDCDDRCYINPAFRYMYDVVSWHFGLGAFPSTGAKLLWASAALANIETISNLKRACYPVHLTTLQALTLAEASDGLYSLTRLAFCSSAKSLKLPLTEWYCERLDVSGWLDGYVQQGRQYEHHRCPGFENTLEEKNVRKPPLDWLLIYHLAKEQ